jgi:hypothetical protein
LFGRAAGGGTTELAGLVLTGGYRPRPRDLDVIRSERLFAMLVEDDTYEAASEVHDLLVKTHPADREKIDLTRRLVSEHIDVDSILARFVQPTGSASGTEVGSFGRLASRGLRSLTRAAARAAGSRSGGRRGT